MHLSAALLASLASLAVALPTSDPSPSLDKRGGIGYGGGIGGAVGGGFSANAAHLRVNQADAAAAAKKKNTAFAAKDDAREKEAALAFKVDDDVAVYREDLHIEYITKDVFAKENAAALAAAQNDKVAAASNKKTAAAAAHRTNLNAANARTRAGFGGYGGGIYKRGLDNEKRGFGGGYGGGLGYGGGFGRGGFGGEGFGGGRLRNTNTAAAARQRFRHKTAFANEDNLNKNQHLDLAAVQLHESDRVHANHATAFNNKNSASASQAARLRHNSAGFGGGRSAFGGYGGGIWKRQEGDFDADEGEGDDVLEKRRHHHCGHRGHHCRRQIGDFEGDDIGDLDGGDLDELDFVKRQEQEDIAPEDGGDEEDETPVEKRQYDDDDVDGGEDGGEEDSAPVEKRQIGDFEGGNIGGIDDIGGIDGGLDGGIGGDEL